MRVRKFAIFALYIYYIRKYARKLSLNLGRRENVRKYLIILIIALIILSVIKHKSIDKAVELCKEGKGDPLVEKDFIALNWSVG
jgi:hypothetical protein